MIIQIGGCCRAGKRENGRPALLSSSLSLHVQLILIVLINALCFNDFIVNATTTSANNFSYIRENDSSESKMPGDLIQQDPMHGFTSDHTRVLSRKRRYLVFPEGSSFQLVYDQIIGVVDYTNYLILGITVALAWELPSKPPSEVLADLKERLRDGTLGISRNDTIENVVYKDSMFAKPSHPAYITLENSIRNGIGNNFSYYKNNKQPFHPPMHFNYYHYEPHPSSDVNIPNRSSRPVQPIYYKKSGYSPNNKNNNNWRRKDNFYYSYKHNPFTEWTKKKPFSHSGSDGSYPWWNLTDRLRSSLKKFRPSASKANKRTGNYQSSDASMRKHRIYPVFGKRSIPNAKNLEAPENHSHRQRRNGIEGLIPSKLDRIHIRHHRSTRHNLYDKIEKYLNARGLNGHHCVLRTLCETGQKQHELEPGTFIGEIMRTVFTLPEAIDEDLHSNGVHYKHQLYDAAREHKGDCANRYQLCKESLWEASFVA